MLRQLLRRGDMDPVNSFDRRPRLHAHEGRCHHLRCCSPKAAHRDSFRAFAGTAELGAAGWAGLALITRLALLASIAWIIGLTRPVFELFGHPVSWRESC